MIIGDWIINTREKDGKIELRPRFQVKLFEQENGFYFRPRVEYRDRRKKEKVKKSTLDCGQHWLEWQL